MSFENYSTETLIKIERNLFTGLDLVNDSILNGTFRKVGDSGKAPPAESGSMTLWLALQVSKELDNRLP